MPYTLSLNKKMPYTSKRMIATFYNRKINIIALFLRRKGYLPNNKKKRTKRLK
jgi:hypothetical protein